MTKISGNSHFPLMVSEQGETVIQLADGGTFGVADAFTEGGIVDRHTAAKEFAARLVRAANCHDAMLSVLEAYQQRFELYASADHELAGEHEKHLLTQAKAIIAKAKGERP